MNAAAHQITRCGINHAVTGDGVFAGKGCGNNLQIVVAAFFGASVAGVAMRFVLNDQRSRSNSSISALTPAGLS